jgi:hypothetical protein
VVVPRRRLPCDRASLQRRGGSWPSGGGGAGDEGSASAVPGERRRGRTEKVDFFPANLNQKKTESLVFCSSPTPPHPIETVKGLWSDTSLASLLTIT